MSNFSIGGLATGLDTQSIISKLMDVERAPEKVLQAKQKTYQSQSSVYTQLNTALTNLQNLAEGMNTSSGFMATQSSAADSSVLTVSSTNSATPGTHTLQVTSLARSQRQVSTGYADGTVFNTGTFTIDDGAGNVTSVNLAEGSNNLAGLASAINGSGANVTASIINDGSATPNRLVINGNDIKNYTFDFSGLGQAPATDGAAVQLPTLLDSTDPSYQAGSPASFLLDGVTMTKNSNTVSDALSGVTLNLLKEGATTTFNVTNDTTAITKKITDFIAGYNSAISIINKQSTYDATNKTAGVLSGDTTLRSIQNQLQSLLTTTVSGLNGPYQNLAQLGITSDKSDGTLSVDSTKLTTALSNNYKNVVDLFSHNNAAGSLATNQYGIAQQFNVVLEGMVHFYEGPSSTHNGIIATRIHGLQSSVSDINDQISDMEDRIAAMQAGMETKFNAMESLVSNLQSQGNSLLSALGASTTSSSSSKSSSS